MVTSIATLKQMDDGHAIAVLRAEMDDLTSTPLEIFLLDRVESLLDNGNGNSAVQETADEYEIDAPDLEKLGNALIQNAANSAAILSAVGAARLDTPEAVEAAPRIPPTVPRSGRRSRRPHPPFHRPHQPSKGVIQMFPTTVTVTNPTQLAAVMAVLGVEIPNVTAPVVGVKAEPKKETPAKKEAPAAAPTAEAAAAASTAPVEEAAAPAPKAENSEPLPACTYDDAAKAVQGLAKAKGRDAAVNVLASFGVAKLPELTDTSKFAAVVEACNNALKG